MDTNGADRRTPRAVVHKQVLDRAAANPEASIEALAARVSGASPDLVERILEEYGEPAASTDAGADTEDRQHDRDSNERPMSTNASVSQTAIEQLSEKQLRVLRAIHEDPEATQQELAQRLDVSRATVSKRVSAIDGLDWETREAFVTELFENGTDPTPDSTAELARAVRELQAKVGALESRLDEFAEDRSPDRDAPFGDPDLAAKVIRACVTTETITEDEELHIIRRLLG